MSRADRGKDKRFLNVVCFGATSCLDDHLGGLGGQREGNGRYASTLLLSWIPPSHCPSEEELFGHLIDSLQSISSLDGKARCCQEAAIPSSTLADPFHAHSGRHAILPDTGRENATMKGAARDPTVRSCKGVYSNVAFSPSNTGVLIDTVSIWHTHIKQLASHCGWVGIIFGNIIPQVCRGAPRDRLRIFPAMWLLLAMAKRCQETLMVGPGGGPIEALVRRWQ